MNHHHDDEMSAAEALAIFNRVAGIAPAPTGEPEAAPLATDDEPPEAYAEFALATFARAAAGMGLKIECYSTPAPAAPPTHQTARSARFGEGSIASDLAKVAALVNEMGAKVTGTAPAASSLDALIERARSLPPAKPTPTAEQLAQARARVDAAFSDYDKIADLPEKARAKMYLAYNTFLVEEAERRCTSLGLTAGPAGEPLKSWIAGTMVEKLIQANAQKKAGTLKMLDGYNVAMWAARGVMGEALKLSRRAERSAA